MNCIAGLVGTPRHYRTQTPRSKRFVTMIYYYRLPLKLLVLANEFINDVQVVLLEILNLRNLVALAVEIVRVESLDGLQHALILLVHHPLVRTTSVPRVE